MSMDGKNIANTDNVPTQNLPKPHTCPWLMQYALISPIRRLLESPNKILAPYIEPGMTVLDPGCGFGFFSLPLAQMVGEDGRVVSVDLEPRAVERLKQRAAKKGLAHRIDARPCSTRDLGLNDYRGRIDLITAMNILHEVEDISGFLSQSRELLKPNGKLLVMEPRGHLTPDNFAAELECSHRAGFRELTSPPYHRKRFTALLELDR